MSEIIKTSEIPHDELIIIYEQRCIDLKKEYDRNQQLEREKARLQKTIDTLHSDLEKILKTCKIALQK